MGVGKRAWNGTILFVLALPESWQIVGKWFLSEGPANGKSENDRINTEDLWWAWVDLNHRPRPYQEGDLRNMFASRIETVSR
jgi:hypothetical protein